MDWHEVFSTEFATDWLPGQFCERGQQMSLVGDGKAGKTLFVHEWLWRAVTGRRFLGDERRDPIRVLYFDRENSLRDIATRMASFGATPDELGGFGYRPFPKFTGALNADPAAEQLLRLVDETKPDVVVFDTASRYITGKENDSETWLELYNHVHAPLKDRGIAGIRLDHFGKDSERGSRGSSAKSQDVDHVWELTALQKSAEVAGDVTTEVTNLKLSRTHTRTGLGREVFYITRRGGKDARRWLPGGTRHELTAADEVQARNETIASYVDQLQAASVPKDLGREKLREIAKSKGVILPGKTELLAEIKRAYKDS